MVLLQSYHLPKTFQSATVTRKAAEPLVAAVLQGLMWMVLLQSYHLPKTFQSATATKGARPILLWWQP